MKAFDAAKLVHRSAKAGGYHLTQGHFTYMKNPLTFWSSQRQAAKALGVSANVLSKYLSGKLPNLYR